MKAKISALMDGELERQDAEAALEALGNEGEARDTWRVYHLIGDSMRDARLLSAGFAARVAGQIAQEPTVLAPARAQRRAANAPLWALSAAASLAAVALVGWLAFAPQSQDELQVAKAPPPPQALPAKEVAQVAPPDAADDYLLAHQGYSPRNSLQGLAPYVRTVSAEARGARP
jgi:sigma-E factor negative regulatory protein RseA